MEEIAMPIIGRDVYIAPTAYVGGQVTIGDGCTVMHFVVIRGDIAPIRLGKNTNVQDAAVLHTPHGTPLDIGADVGIGHRAVVHCRRVGDRSLIGIGAVVLDNCIVGSRCLIAAGCLVPPESVIPDDSVVMGIPGKIVRSTSASDLQIIDHVVQSYRLLGRLHAEGRFPNIVAQRTNGPLPADPAECYENDHS